MQADLMALALAASPTFGNFIRGILAESLQLSHRVLS